MGIFAEVFMPLGRIVLLQSTFEIVRVADVKTAF